MLLPSDPSSKAVPLSADAEPAGAGPATADALARLYDVDLLEDPGDLDLYVALASRTGGPIVEFAAGSGRLAIPLAVSGFEVVCVDIDPAMLRRARARADGAADAVAAAGGSIDFVHDDMVTWRPERRRFRLAILGLNSIMLLTGREAQAAAIRSMAAALEPGGVAVVDVWLPDANELSRYDGRLGLEYVRDDPETGRVVVKTASADYEVATGHVALTTIFEEGSQGEPARRWVREDRLRLVNPDELRAMAEEAGLEVEVIAGTYDLDPIRPYDDRAILIARRGARHGSRSLV